MMSKCPRCKEAILNPVLHEFCDFNLGTEDIVPVTCAPIQELVAAPEWSLPLGARLRLVLENEEVRARLPIPFGGQPAHRPEKEVFVKKPIIHDSAPVDARPPVLINLPSMVKREHYGDDIMD